MNRNLKASGAFHKDGAENSRSIGGQAWDIHTLQPIGGHWLDPRVCKKIVGSLETKGLKFVQKGYLDTGLGSVAIIRENGTVDGDVAPLSSAGFTPGFNH